MKKRFLTALCIGALATAYASADVITSDLVLVQSGGTPNLADHFDNGVIEPFWLQVGTPGPEHGTVVDLDPGDGLVSLVDTTPGVLASAFAVFDVTNLAIDGAVLLLLGGTEPGDLLGMAVGRDAAFMFDETGPLNGILYTPAPNVVLAIGTSPEGAVLGLVNDEIVFVGPNPFSSIGAVGIAHIPEPGALLLIGSGLLAISFARHSGRPTRQ